MENQPVDILYGVNDRPPFLTALFAAFQHLLAIFVPIVTPALIICTGLEVGVADKRYIVSMSLLISGVATMIQIRRLGPVGSGLLSIQGTSYSFVGVLLAAGASHSSLPKASLLALLFGMCLAGSCIEMVLSRCIHQIRQVITPLVSGIVVTLIGLTLIKAGIFNCAGGAAAMAEGSFGSVRHFGLAMLVLGLIVLANRSRRPWLRMSSILIGLALGFLASILMGWVDYSELRGLEWVVVPVPFKYGFRFEWAPFVPIALVYLVTSIETMGDITATSMVSGEPVRGPLYLKRISGGVLADGLNSLLASAFNTFPNTTFSQNNGVIQITGVASRSVGMLVALFLVILGLLPQVAGIFAILPAPVLGGATLLMFGTVAAAGIKLMATRPLTRRSMLIIAVSLGLGLGVTFHDAIFAQFPGWARQLLNSGIVLGAFSAVACQLLLPQEGREDEAGAD